MVTVNPSPLSKTGYGKAKPVILKVPRRRLSLLVRRQVVTASWVQLPFNAAQLRAAQMRSDL